jgi:hypothetical protein
MDERIERCLYEANRDRYTPRLPESHHWNALYAEIDVRVMEIETIEAQRRTVAERAAQAPTEPGAFVRWFEALRAPGSEPELFEWLANHATRDEMRWFLRQQVISESGFDDLVALAQLRLPPRAKRALARNYWDEMGRGQSGAMHATLLERVDKGLRLDEIATSVWEALALSNLMVGLAANRQYAYQVIGALGMVELVAPAQAALINRGLKRLGVQASVRRYFAVHANLDAAHSVSWNAEALAPLVAEHPLVAPAIAEGALLRLDAGRRCLARCRAELGVDQERLRRSA